MIGAELEQKTCSGKEDQLKKCLSLVLVILLLAPVSVYGSDDGSRFDNELPMLLIYDDGETETDTETEDSGSNHTSSDTIVIDVEDSGSTGENPSTGSGTDISDSTSGAGSSAGQNSSSGSGSSSGQSTYSSYDYSSQSTYSSGNYPGQSSSSGSSGYARASVTPTPAVTLTPVPRSTVTPTPTPAATLSPVPLPKTPVRPKVITWMNENCPWVVIVYKTVTLVHDCRILWDHVSDKYPLLENLMEAEL